MRYSQMFLPTVREVPSDAEVISHQLMIRAGMIRKLTSGIYSVLPLGYRTVKKVEEIIARGKAAEKELDKLKKAAAVSDVDSLISSAKEVNGVKIISMVSADLDVEGLRSISDSLRERVQNSVVCLGSAAGGKAMLLYAATKPAVDKGIDCGKLIKDTVGIVGGGGGGRRDMAQAGGKDASGLQKAIDEAVKLAEVMIK